MTSEIYGYGSRIGAVTNTFLIDFYKISAYETKIAMLTYRRIHYGDNVMFVLNSNRKVRALLIKKKTSKQTQTKGCYRILQLELTEKHWIEANFALNHNRQVSILGAVVIEKNTQDSWTVLH